MRILNMGNTLIILGLMIALLGIVLNLFTKIRLPLLPGDILMQKDGFTLYIPIVTSLLVSAILTIILNLYSQPHPEMKPTKAIRVLKEIEISGRHKFFNDAGIFADAMADYLEYVRGDGQYRSETYDLGNDAMEVTRKLG